MSNNAIIKFPGKIKYSWTPLSDKNRNLIWPTICRILNLTRKNMHTQRNVNHTMAFLFLMMCIADLSTCQFQEHQSYNVILQSWKSKVFPPHTGAGNPAYPCHLSGSILLPAYHFHPDTPHTDNRLTPNTKLVKSITCIQDGLRD